MFPNALAFLQKNNITDNYDIKHNFERYIEYDIIELIDLYSEVLDYYEKITKVKDTFLHFEYCKLLTADGLNFILENKKSRMVFDW